MKIQPGQSFRVRGDDRVRQCVRCEPRVCCGLIRDVVDDADGERFFAHLCDLVEEAHVRPFVVGDRVRNKILGMVGVVFNIRFAGPTEVLGRAVGWVLFVDLGNFTDRWIEDDCELAPVIDESQPAPHPFDSRGRYLGGKAVRG